MDQSHPPQIHYTPGVEKFFKDVLDMEPEQFVLRLESFLVGGSSGMCFMCGTRFDIEISLSPEEALQK